MTLYLHNLISFTRFSDYFISFHSVHLFSITMTNNSSSSLSNITSTPKIYVVLNIISLSATTTGTFLCFLMLTGVLLRKKTFHDVQLLLCTNSYIIVFFLGVFEFKHNLNTLLGDFGLLVMNKETLECRILGYILFSLISAVYLACVLQVSYIYIYTAYRTD